MIGGSASPGADWLSPQSHRLHDNLSTTTAQMTAEVQVKDIGEEDVRSKDRLLNLPCILLSYGTILMMINIDD